ncbi:hypothetical protein MKJ01_12940 [Chryseobacterium sp. SSA4.19]|uniref:hypothetical protein n=1 Tax=Chryseobacterium sp. SSA4.19 TaxID=2919915 RepID=UPI001F4E2433|nr:hypothetical protein [Chryseobacterium sp. SSA4.19]MCJ8154671.1 hypothetical protein [Chryseobacterium sp. SSA4.19]
MKKIFLLTFLYCSAFAFSQEQQNKKQTMGLYVNPTLNLGYNLGNSIKDSQNKDSQYYQQYISPYLPNKITYGITAVAGYNFIPNLALGSGLKYSFIDDNFHLLYWVIQPKVIFNAGDEPIFIDLSYGKQINNSVVSDSQFYGLKIGMQVSYSKRLSQEGGIILESHKFENSSAVFVGLSYGITIFSNKNYTAYGED